MNALIVTYVYANNYGSFLQAWSLQNYLQKLGLTVYFFGEQTAQDYKFDNFYQAKVADVLSKSRQLFKIEHDSDKKFDLIIVGSDVVWASTKIKKFWGIGLNGRYLCSYAASIYGMCSNIRLHKSIANFIIATRLLRRIHALRKFKYISVRDEKTQKAIKTIIPLKKVTKVLDPTFFNDFYKLNLQAVINEKYILIYTYGLPDYLWGQIESYAKKRNLKICTVGTEEKRGNYNLTPTPKELISLFLNSSAVVSTTFHGTALAIECKCNFAMFESQKSIALLKDLNLEGRIISNNLENILDTIIDYDDVYKKISANVELSKEYLNLIVEKAKNERNM